MAVFCCCALLNADASIWKPTEARRDREAYREGSPSKQNYLCAVIGGSVGSFFAGTVIAGLLGLYVAERRLRKQSQVARSNTAAHVGAKTEWRTELQATQASVATPAPGQIGMGPPKYEMEGREVFETP